MCAPAIVVEAVYKQMDGLRFKLYTHMIEEKGSMYSAHYYCFINFYGIFVSNFTYLFLMVVGLPTYAEAA